jgi:hypothetical protein
MIPRGAGEDARRSMVRRFIGPPEYQNHYFKKNPSCSGGGSVLLLQY